VFGELPFQNRFQYMAKRRLHNAISNRRDSERPSLVATWLRDVRTAYPLHLVCASAQVIFQFANVPGQVRSEIFDRDMVHTGFALVPSNLTVCGEQVLGLVDFVD
jgi:hypothetical protein